MDMDNALFLQKQIKENSQDLQKEFLDMETWEEQMKKKDLELRNSKNNESLPAVRSKIKKKSVPPPVKEVPTDEKPKKTKRTKPLDYDAWNKFDVDKACEEIDGPNINSRNAKTKKIYEIASEEELEKDFAIATIFKNEGNLLVQEKQYVKAVGKYSEAIKVFPHDAAFYANRALCQLKLNNLYSAEGDCTAAIELDRYYVKAYHRRATARIELKHYKDAVKDLEILLKLEPSNKEAARMLAIVQKKISNAKPMIISGEDIDKNDSIEKAIGQKLLGKKSLSSKEVNKSSNKEQSHSNTSNNKQSVFNETKKHNNDSVENIENIKLKTSHNKNNCIIKESNNVSKMYKKMENTDPKLPNWLPKQKINLKIVQPLAKVPNRLNQTLKRVFINEISPNESIFKDIEIIKKDEASKINAQIENNVKINTNKQFENKSCNVEDCSKNNVQSVDFLPPPPKTSVNFITNWTKNISSEYRRKYLKQIIPDNLSDIFKESLESKIFGEILLILSTEFISNNDKVYDLLINFTKVRRFRALILFMTKQDKEALKNLVKYCKSIENKTDEEINHLCTMYEI